MPSPQRELRLGKLIISSGQTEGAGATVSNMILVQNWFEELKRLVPTN